MGYKKLQNQIGNIDIYLLDQILKERYQPQDILLDAGCGSGRNLHWFYQNDYTVYAVDQEAEHIAALSIVYPKWEDQISVHSLNQLPYQSDFFDHIICSAVLHFARNTDHFKMMFSELIRVLQPQGSLFIRMTSNIGIEDKITLLEEGVYMLGDESNRFLLTEELLSGVMHEHRLSFLEPIKSTNVNDLRCMTTLMLQKNR